eukprot:COSAG04_NODE_33547_length_141_cov_1286.785714_1_plen_27_part_01
MLGFWRKNFMNGFTKQFSEPVRALEGR